MKCRQCGGSMEFIETDELGDYYECDSCDWDEHIIITKSGIIQN